MSNHYILDLTDPLGRRITLTPETWNDHIQRRPEMAELLSALAPTVEQPDLIIVTGETERRYYRHGSDANHPRRDVQVIVQLTHGGWGAIATAWHVRRRRQGAIEWPK